MKTLFRKAIIFFTHLFGKVTKKYYFEDFVRVYPDGLSFNFLGKKRRPAINDFNNYLNHNKFYFFAAQFVNQKSVVDVGCGSGYGSKILKESGALYVDGYDISKSSIRYAKSFFGDYGSFFVSPITNMSQVLDNSYDVAICSEVIEHIKNYQMEQRAIDELKRITKRDGIVIISTPNTESLKDHGFSYDEINNLLSKKFSLFCIFENAFVPFGEHKKLWNKRFDEKNTGIIISEIVNLEESVVPIGLTPEIKVGLEPGVYKFENYDINTKLLHNTHSWVIIALNNPM